jgi:hypothetical protein
MFFKEQGIKRFHATTELPALAKYDLRNGFEREEGRPGRYVNSL